MGAFRARLAVLAVLLAGCAGRERPEPWRVEVDGCETWVATPACILGKEGSTLRLWVAGAEPVELELDGRRLDLAARPAVEGLFFAVPVPPDGRRLRLRRPRRDDFELALWPSLRPEAFEEIDDLAYSTDPLEQARALELLARQPDAAPAWKLYLQARSAMRGGRREEARILAEKGAALWQADGRTGYQLNELILSSYLAALDGGYPESRRFLDQAAGVLGGCAGWPALPVRLHYLTGHQRAVLAFQTGDVRTALTSLAGLESFERHHVLEEGEISDLYQLKANLLGELGRFAAAAQVLDALAGQDESPERRASREINRGWVTLLARQAGQTAEDPAPYFQRAWEYYRTSGEGHQKLNSLINLAATALLDRQLDAAGNYLRDARPWRSQAIAHEGFMFDRLEARLRLLGGDPQAALDQFRRLDLEASRRHLPAARWQALVGQAEALAALGQRTAAIEAYERAERLENGELIFIPLDGGRETFLAQREATTRQHVELLLAEGQTEKALDLVRRRRVQPLALLQRDERVASLGPEDRRAWDEAAAGYLLQATAAPDASPIGGPPASRAAARAASGDDQLAALADAALARLGLPRRDAPPRPLRPGELTLAFFPRDGSWLVFALDRQGLDVQLVEAPPGTGLPAVAAALLKQVAPRIAACQRLRILPWGDLDVHAVELAGAPLFAAKPLVYGVDAGPSFAPPAAAGARRSGLLVADASQLGWTMAEIDFAEGVLRSRGDLQLEPTLYNHQATPALVRAGLERAGYFHFAGHGEFDPAGSQSRLLLPDGELTAADVLTLRQVPDQVLLSSCYVGQPARAAGIEGLGLAYAFVLAGSRQVLAATRQVDDEETARLIHRLYESIAQTPGEIDLAIALQQAQLDLRRRGESDAWKAFRVFEP